MESLLVSHHDYNYYYITYNIIILYEIVVIIGIAGTIVHVMVNLMLMTLIIIYNKNRISIFNDK